MAKTKTTYVWKDPGALAGWTVGVLAATALVQFGALALNLIFGSASHYTGDESVFTTPQFVKWSFDILDFALLLPCIVVVGWIWRVTANGHVFKPSMRFSPLGAIGFYLVPLVSLFLPFQAMEEIWFVSAGKTTRTPPLLRWWWGGFLLSNIAGLFALRLPGEIAAPMEAVANAAAVVSVVCFIQIVRTVTAMQRERYPLIQLGELPSEADGILERLSAG